MLTTSGFVRSRVDVCANRRLRTSSASGSFKVRCRAGASPAPLPCKAPPQCPATRAARRTRTLCPSLNKRFAAPRLSRGCLFGSDACVCATSSRSPKDSVLRFLLWYVAGQGRLSRICGFRAFGASSPDELRTHIVSSRVCIGCVAVVVGFVGVVRAVAGTTGIHFAAWNRETEWWMFTRFVQRVHYTIACVASPPRSRVGPLMTLTRARCMRLQHGRLLRRATP
jgi:hypothetical protein